MEKRFNLKNILILFVPLLMFPVLFVPYDWVNQAYIVKQFGCGCQPSFNANDFTALFWLFISLGVTAISVFLSKKMPKEQIWLRIIYVAGMLVVSLLIARQFCQTLMWL